MNSTHFAGAALSLVLVACGHSQHSEGNAAPSTRIVKYSNSPMAGPVELLLRGISITVDSPIGNELSIESRSGSGSSYSMTINMDKNPPAVEGEDPNCRFWIRAQPLLVRDDHLWIGASDFGAVAESDTVHIDAGGVKVNGESRGALPGD
jgi:hypothetical protein